MSSTVAARKPEIWQQNEIKRKDIHEWTIPNYPTASGLKKQNEKIESPVFKSGTKSECNWRLDLYPSYPGMLFFKLILLKDTPDIMNNRVVNITLSLLNADKEEKDKIIHDASSASIRPTADFYDRFTIMEDVLDEKKKFLLNNALTIVIEITTVVRNSSMHSQKNDDDSSITPLQDRLSIYLDNEEFSDVVLNVRGTKLKAHKILLSAQSTVFAELLKNNCNNDEIKIDDLEPEVARQMLMFVYTDCEPDKIEELTKELITASCKYKMLKLKLMGERILIKRINNGNAIDTLAFADDYGSERLKEQAIEFIGTDLALLESNDFAELERNHAELARELYRKLLLKRTKISDDGK